MKMFAFTHRKGYFCPAFSKVEVKRDQCISFSLTQAQQAAYFPAMQKQLSSPGENQVLGGSKVEASTSGKQRVAHSRKGPILVHDRGELQPPGSTRALASHRTRVQLAGSATVLPPGNMAVLPPGSVTIPLVSGVVAFH